MTQKEALDILKLGYNCYITGAAGSGKTHLLNSYIKYLQDHEVDIGITASTGIAATHIGGITIHSWSGIGTRKVLTDKDLDDMEQKQYLWKRIDRVKVLIIDEVSMLHDYYLDMVDQLLKKFKRSEEPFGGIQIVLCGDFFQLPPVSKYGEPDARFVYESESWKEGRFKICYLKEQHRQKDEISTKVLNAIRSNGVDHGIMSHLKTRFKKAGSESTRLYTHNVDVDKVNYQALNLIKGAEKEYEMESRGTPILVEILKKSCLAPESLRLRIGAKVMFVKNNFDLDYVNGTLGVVKALKSESGGPIVETISGDVIEVPKESWTIEEDGKVKAEIMQYPLRLAWAITVHKSQGMSLDSVEVDLSKSFEKGMGYVALSRVKSFEGLHILGLNEAALLVKPEVLSYDRQLKESSNVSKGLIMEIAERGMLHQGKESFIKSVAPDWIFRVTEDGDGSEDGKPRKIKKERKKISTYEKTRLYVKEKISLKEMAMHRDVNEETILAHLEKLIEEKKITRSEIGYLKKNISDKKFDDIARVLFKVNKKSGSWNLAPVKNELGSKISYRDIQLVRLFIRK